MPSFVQAGRRSAVVAVGLTLVACGGAPSSNANTSKAEAASACPDPELDRIEQDARQILAASDDHESASPTQGAPGTDEMQSQGLRLRIAAEDASPSQGGAVPAYPHPAITFMIAAGFAMWAAWDLGDSLGAKMKATEVLRVSDLARQESCAPAASPRMSRVED